MSISPTGYLNDCFTEIVLLGSSEMHFKMMQNSKFMEQKSLSFFCTSKTMRVYTPVCGKALKKLELCFKIDGQPPKTGSPLKIAAPASNEAKIGFFKMYFLSLRVWEESLKNLVLCVCVFFEFQSLKMESPSK